MECDECDFSVFDDYEGTCTCAFGREWGCPCDLWQSGELPPDDYEEDWYE